MPFNLKKFKTRLHLGMGVKLSFAVAAIIVILVLSSIISIIEFRRISTLVSDRVSEDIRDINLSSEFAVTSNKYNLLLLSTIGEADFRITSDIDHRPYREALDTILGVFLGENIKGADSLRTACDDYMSTACQVDSVIVSDFIDSREWYFLSLQPKYNNLCRCQEALNKNIYNSLHDNSIDFDESFYRGVMPGVVSVMAAIILLLLLLFYLLAYYVRPIRKMLRNFEAYRHYSQPYNTVFEGNDEIQELNGDLAECVDENIILKRKLRKRES